MMRGSFVVVIAVIVAIAAVMVAGAPVTLRRAPKIHRALQPLASAALVETDTDADADADANTEIDTDAESGVRDEQTERAHGKKLSADEANYHYPEAEPRVGGGGGAVVAGTVPLTEHAREVVRLLAESLDASMLGESKKWPMIGVGISHAKRTIIIARSGSKHDSFKFIGGDIKGFRALLTKNAEKWGGPLDQYDIVNLGEHYEKDWASAYTNAVGAAMKVPDVSDLFGIGVVAVDKLKCPNSKALPSEVQPADVWALRKYPEGLSQDYAATHTYDSGGLQIAQGYGFGNCAGTKIAAYATVAGMMPLDGMAERKGDADAIRASCQTCQHVIREMWGASATHAFTKWEQTKVATLALRKETLKNLPSLPNNADSVDKAIEAAEHDLTLRAEPNHGGRLVLENDIKTHEWMLFKLQSMENAVNSRAGNDPETPAIYQSVYDDLVKMPDSVENRRKLTNRLYDWRRYGKEAKKVVDSSTRASAKKTAEENIAFIKHKLDALKFEDKHAADLLNHLYDRRNLEIEIVRLEKEIKKFGRV